MIIKTFVLIEQENRYLLIQEAGVKNRGKWFLPGGRTKRNEDPAEAVVRETMEEAGVQVQLTGIFFVKCYSGLFSSKVHVFYTGLLKGGKVKTYEDKHSMQARWCTYEEMRQLPLRQKMIRLVERYRKNGRTIPVKSLKLVVFRGAFKKLL